MKILGPPVHALDLHKYDLPYSGAAGILDPRLSDDIVDLMLVAAEKFKDEIHIVSYMENRDIYNRFRPDAMYYQNKNKGEIRDYLLWNLQVI